MTNFIQYMVIGIAIGLVYALICLSVVLIIRASKIFNFAIGDMVVLGGYFSWLIFSRFMFNTWLGLAVNIVAFALIGFLIHQFVLKKAIGQPIFSLVMITIGLSLVFRGMYILAWGSEMYGLPGFFPNGILMVGNIVISELYAVSTVIIVLVFIVISLLLKFTKIGLEMRASAESHILAQSIGVRVNKTLVISWVLASIIALISGLIMTSLVRVSPQLSTLTFKALPVLILGGMESILGCIVGGLIIGIVEMLTSGYLTPAVGMDMGEIVPYLVLFVVLLIRPEGLFGLKIIKRV
jgi:branched-chain amino acid transport system permease protein